MKINGKIITCIFIFLFLVILSVLLIYYFSKNHFSNLTSSNDFQDLKYENFITNIITNISWQSYISSTSCDLFQQKLNIKWYIQLVPNLNYIYLDRVNKDQSYSAIPIVFPNSDSCKTTNKYIFNKAFFTQKHFRMLQSFIKKNPSIKYIQPINYIDLSQGWKQACLEKNKYCVGTPLTCCDDQICSQDNKCVSSS